MRILFAAPFSGIRTSIFISGYYHALARAASAAGDEVGIYDTGELIASPRIHPLLRRLYPNLAPLVERLRLLSLLESQMRSNFLSKCREFSPDIVFVYVINAQSMWKVIREIRKSGVVVAMWVGLNPSVASAGARDAIREADCIFIYDESYLPLYLELGCRRVEVVPFGIDKEAFDSIAPGQAKSTGISFVGMMDNERYHLLTSIRDLQLGVWSWNWLYNRYQLLNHNYRGEAAGAEAIRAFKASQISVNIHRTFEVSGGNYRLFEIPACGTLQLVDRKPAIGKYFVDGEEIVFFDDAKDLRKKSLYYLSKPDELATIARQGRERVEREHTIGKRFTVMRQILEEILLAKS